MLNPSGKIAVLREYAERFGLRTGVETGIYVGHGSMMEMQDVLDTIILLDFDHLNCAAAMQACPRATVVCGDSRWTLPTVLTRLDEPALFWLDAHLIEIDGPLTGDYPCPLLDELDAIARLARAGSVILVDDLRQMGENGWPTIERLREKAHAHWGQVEEADDIMRITGWLS